MAVQPLTVVFSHHKSETVTAPWAWQMVVFERPQPDGTALDGFVECKELNFGHYCPNGLWGLVSGAR